jgi:hypothetical protein
VVSVELDGVAAESAVPVAATVGVVSTTVVVVVTTTVVTVTAPPAGAVAEGSVPGSAAGGASPAVASGGAVAWSFVSAVTAPVSSARAAASVSRLTPA